MKDEDERSIQDRMICAAAVASRFPKHEGVVSIHVGQEGWDWLQSLVDKPHAGESDVARGFPVLLEAAWPTAKIVEPEVARAWGFPILLEAAWPTAKIVVRSDQVIW